MCSSGLHSGVNGICHQCHHLPAGEWCSGDECFTSLACDIPSLPCRCSLEMNFFFHKTPHSSGTRRKIYSITILKNEFIIVFLLPRFVAVNSFITHYNWLKIYFNSSYKSKTIAPPVLLNRLTKAPR